MARAIEVRDRLHDPAAGTDVRLSPTSNDRWLRYRKLVDAVMLMRSRQRNTENIMAETTARFENAAKSRVQDATDRAHDYLDRASQTASSGMDRVADTARRGVDTAAESAKAGLDWASDKASVLRDRNAALMNAVTDSVSARPLIAIAVAAGLGYLIGRIMRNSD
jgi:ElaB/YqjD/DUF883 family membrane-anchored ribosome-binding protein